MAHQFTFPILLNDTKRISVTNLKKWGYLEPNRVKSGDVTWSRNGFKTGSISIVVNTIENFVELIYTANDKPRKYRVRLESVPSNLGSGEIWYFVCRVTHKRCRNLYYGDGYFLHRDALNGAMYETQTYSRKSRTLIQLLDRSMKGDEAYGQQYRKHFKKFYNGKPTKKYLRILWDIENSKGVPSFDDLLMM